MKTATFKNFELSPGQIVFNTFFSEDGKAIKEDCLHFTLSEKFLPHNDLIGYACSTLAYGFDEILFELPLSKQCQTQISAFAKAAVVKAPFLTELPPLEESFSARTELAMSFSGGFDSMAALALIPSNVKLISIDFGGHFSREGQFFNDFSPYTVTTNLRTLGYNHYSWTFMGIGALLYSQHLNIKNHIFGTALEDSTHNLCLYPANAHCNQTPPFSYAGIKDIHATNGLSTPCSTKLVHHYYPNLFIKSLTSLASDGTEKLYRKWQVSHILYTVFLQKPNPIPRPSIPSLGYKLIFGSDLAAGFTSFYIIKYLGLEEALHTQVSIPYEVEFLSSFLNFDFFNKFHDAFLAGIPSDLQPYYFSRLEKAGIASFEENDKIAFQLVSQCVVRFFHLYQKRVLPYSETFVYLIKKENIKDILNTIKLLEEHTLYPTREILCLCEYSLLSSALLNDFSHIHWVPYNFDNLDSLLINIPLLALSPSISFKNLCPEEEKQLLNRAASTIYSLHHNPTADNALVEVKKELRLAEDRYTSLFNSRAYKIGNALLSIPRKIRNLLK